MFCLNMLAIALELARHDDAYEDVATKFLEHFFYIAHAMNDRAPRRPAKTTTICGTSEDEFYYDLLRLADGSTTLHSRALDGRPDSAARRRDDGRRAARASCRDFARGSSGSCTIAPISSATRRRSRARAKRTGGCSRSSASRGCARSSRACSTRGSSCRRTGCDRCRAGTPTIRSVCDVNGRDFGEVDYEPAESRSGLFGGNSNWRGPVWFPLNYLIIEALQKFDWYYGSTFRVEHPVGLGTHAHAVGGVGRAVAAADRALRAARRPAAGVRRRRIDFSTIRTGAISFSFHEYFHGDNGAGLGASHQTGWTALVAKLIQQSGVPAVT